MPSVTLESPLSDAESSKIVKGWMLFVGINGTLYPQMGTEANHTPNKVIVFPYDPPTPSDSFEWSIASPQGKAHNYALLKQDGTYLYNESSLAADHSGDFYLSGRPRGHYVEEEKLTPIQGVKMRREFRQFNGVDCGFCAAFFVIHVIKQFETWRQQGLSKKEITAVPRANNVFDVQSPGPRIQAIFYGNCGLFGDSPQAVEWSVAVVTKKTVGDEREPDPAEAYPLLREFLNSKLRPEEITEFMRKCFIKPRREPYDKWFIYQNILLYLFIYHQKPTCKLITTNLASLTCQNLYPMATNICGSSNLDAVKKFFSHRDNYLKVAQKLDIAEEQKEVQENANDERTPLIEPGDNDGCCGLRCCITQ